MSESLQTLPVIIVAAGRGRRLGPHTDERPKCLVQVGARSILEWQLAAYRQAGLSRIATVLGYRSEDIDVTTEKFFNTEWQNNNILVSLFCASSIMEHGFIVSYSDIVFGPATVETLLASPADAALVVDRKWQEAYDGREHHPISEAELVEVVGEHIVRVGKRTVTVDRAAGEFIGLARFSATAAGRMCERYAERANELAGKNKPYGNAACFEQSYLTDLFNDLIATGEQFAPVWIDGGWREIDTEEDLERARSLNLSQLLGGDSR